MACNAHKQADRMASRHERKTIYPDYTYDVKVGRTALAEGRTLIEGVVFTKPKTKLGYGAPLADRIYGKNVLITLFPVTPYFEQWYDLRKKRENKLTAVYMSDSAFKYRLTTKSDDYGRFKFEKMKPGKYFLQAFLDWSESKNYKAFVGSGESGYGTTNYYQWQTYTQNHSDRLEKFIEVEAQQSTLSIKLK
jgi:hypothetical protein